jgi:hypothetical protein
MSQGTGLSSTPGGQRPEVHLFHRGDIVANESRNRVSASHLAVPQRPKYARSIGDRKG